MISRAMKTKAARCAVLFACTAYAWGAVQLTLSSAPNPAVLGERVTLTAAVSPAAQTGTVTFYDGPVVLGAAAIHNGVAVFRTTDLGGGRHSLYGRYVVGEGEASAASNKVVQSVIARRGGSFVAWQAPDLPGFQFQSLAAGDLNGDGHPDVVATTVWGTVQTGLTLYVYLNDGHGALGPPAAYLGENSSSSVVIADVNLDGIPDLVAVTPDGVVVLAGKGDGTFATESYVMLASDASQVVVADFNA